MPSADPATRAPMLGAVIDMLASCARKPAIITDCGVGTGQVGRVLTDALGSRIRMLGLEIYRPYVEPGKIRDEIEVGYGGLFHNRYEKIIFTDFCDWLDDQNSSVVDVTIFGDSLEHVEPARAENTLKKAREISTCGVIVCAPVINYGQGPLCGNDHETHLLQWSRADWEKLGGNYVGGNSVVGCFAYSPLLAM